MCTQLHTLQHYLNANTMFLRSSARHDDIFTWTGILDRRIVAFCHQSPLEKIDTVHPKRSRGEQWVMGAESTWDKEKMREGWEGSLGVD
jgi:hypothetical protein